MKKRPNSKSACHVAYLSLCVKITGCKTERIRRSRILQVMSRPSEGGATMDGEVAGPDYTAVPNGVPSPAPPRRTGMSSTLPLGRASGEPSEPRRTQEGTVNGGPSPTERGDAETGVGVSGAMRTDDGRSTGLAVDNTAPGANVRANVATSEGAPQVPAASPTVAQHEGQCTTQQSASTSTPRERLRPPLQQAVQQLSQQRTAVIQAVQNRAQRALQGARMDEGAGTYVEEDFQSMAGSPQATPFQEGDHGGGAWSVTRISEVLHRRLVAPVLEHVGAAGNQPGPSSSSARRSSTSTTAPDSLMSHENKTSNGELDSATYSFDNSCGAGPTKG